MKRIPLLLLVLATPFVRGDVMVEAKTMMGITMKTWTSGLKQRNEIPIPMTGGLLTTITRVDKGVQWTLDPKLKVYDEKAIAVAYEPESRETKMIEGAKENAAAGKAAPFEVRKLDKTRKIAGFPASGYEVKTDGKHSATIWLTPYTEALERAEKETREFSAAHTKELYRNYPAKEREGMEAGMAMMTGMMRGQFLGGGAAPADLPKGYTLAMEGESASGTSAMMTGPDGHAASGAPSAPGAAPKTSTLYEVISLSAEAISPNQFEIPPGFSKVDDVSAMQAQELMKGMMNGGGAGGEVDMQEMMKRMQEGGSGAGGANKPDE